MNNNWLSFSPHIKSHNSINRTYLLFIIALVPALCSAVVEYGYNAAIIVLCSTLTAFVLDLIISIIKNKKFVLYDISSIYTGILVGLVMPPEVSLFAPIIASTFMIVIIKGLCGGTGKNFVSEVAAAKILVALMFGVGFMKFISPLSGSSTTLNIVEGVLSGAKYNYNYLDVLFSGVIGGIGETAILWLVVGGVFLIAAKVIDYKIPLVYLAVTFGLGSLIWGLQSALILISASGAVLVAFFVLTDYASSPKKSWQAVSFAAISGIITILIFKFGKNPILAPFYACLIVNLIYAGVKGLNIKLKKDRRAA